MNHRRALGDAVVAYYRMIKHYIPTCCLFHLFISSEKAYNYPFKAKRLEYLPTDLQIQSLPFVYVAYL